MATKKVPVKLAISANLDGNWVPVELTGELTVSIPEPLPPPDPDPPPPPPPDPDPPEPDPPAPLPGDYSVKVTLYPAAVGDQPVSFGLPLPPGVLADHTNLSVSINGQEVAVYTKAILPWRAIPPTVLLPKGHVPTYPGLRSVLIQFPYRFATTTPVVATVNIGVKGSRLSAGFLVSGTMMPANDGNLYKGDEPAALIPKVLPAIDHKWLAASGIAPFLGLADQSPELKEWDLASRNFTLTILRDFRTSWDAAPKSWDVTAVEALAAVDLTSAEDGPWIFQRAQVLFNVYARTGMLEALKGFYPTATHYRSLIYRPDQVPTGGKMVGFFRVKNTNPAAAYGDPKYSYNEDLLTYLLLTGDEDTLPYFKWISDAQVFGVANNGWTERFQAYGLMGHVGAYEATGEQVYLDRAKAMVDKLVVLSKNTNSAGEVPGCWLIKSSNFEFGVDGYSGWMPNLLAHAFLPYYAATNDVRVPPMLAGVADCHLKSGMKQNSQFTTPIKNPDGSVMQGLVPFYGATTVPPYRDLDGDNFAGVEHAPNVAQLLAIGYAMSSDNVQRARLKDGIMDLIASTRFVWANWTRLTVGKPKFRVAPQRRHNWQLGKGGTVQWALYDKPEIPKE